MFEENKNLKDYRKDSIKDTFSVQAPFISAVKNNSLYQKTDKLVSALYMVTNLMEEGEPLRNKLRTLGIGIVSDMHAIQQNNIGHIGDTIRDKTREVVSFLEIAYTVNMVSEMNYLILRKEFEKLDQSIKDLIKDNGSVNKKINLAEFLIEENETINRKIQDNSIGHGFIGQHQSTRIGVQKGSTLMKAIKDMSLSGVKHPTMSAVRIQDFDILKKQRREDIISIIKATGGNATIKDIKDQIMTTQWKSSSLRSCGEKTLQRELVSMVKDSVLNKTGEKRWSRYFLK